MDTYNTVIDMEKCFGRSKDAFDNSRYPIGLGDVQGILVQEDRKYRPSYQARPGPLVYIAHGAGILSDEEMRAAEESVGMHRSGSEMYGLDKLVYGLNMGSCWGRNLFYSSLIISNNLDSQDPLAMETKIRGWNYLFRPGTLRFGKTGRVLKDKHGKKYNEDLLIKITPDIIYDAVTNGGLNLRKVGLIRQDGSIDVVFDTSICKDGFVLDKFSPEEEIIGFSKDANYKVIDLTQIAEKDGMTVSLPAFVRLTEKYGGTFIFSTVNNYPSLDILADIASEKTDNIVWKLARLGLLEDDRNNFLQNSTWRMYGLPHIWKRTVHLGSTGRQVKISEGGSDWQQEYVSINIDANMISASLMGLGSDLCQIIGFDHSFRLDSAPWEILYEKGKYLSRKSRREFVMAEEKGRDNIEMIPKEIEEMLKPRGIDPTFFD